MKFSEATSGSATDRGRCSYPNLVADVLHRLEEPVQHSQKRQVACGKNGTSAAILGKRRLLGERMLAACNAGIWRMPASGVCRMTSMKRHAAKLSRCETL